MISYFWIGCHAETKAFIPWYNCYCVIEKGFDPRKRTCLLGVWISVNFSLNFTRLWSRHFFWRCPSSASFWHWQFNLWILKKTGDDLMIFKNIRPAGFWSRRLHSGPSVGGSIFRSLLYFLSYLSITCFYELVDTKTFDKDLFPTAFEAYIETSLRTFTLYKEGAKM